MVIPVNTVVRIIGTADGDSMHGWTVPGFGIKKTVIPGRLNEGWINVTKEGYYFGQCSQICGNDHTLHADRGACVCQARLRQVGRQTRRSRPGCCPRPTSLPPPLPPPAKRSPQEIRQWPPRTAPPTTIATGTTTTTPRPAGVAGVYSTNHKDIGTMYLVFSIMAALIGAAFSVYMRLELMQPGVQYFNGADGTPDGHFWNTIVTAHGLIMVFFVVMPGADRRLRQLVRAADDRRARHGVPAHEQHQLLAAAAGLHPAADRPP